MCWFNMAANECLFTPACRWRLKQAVLMIREGATINLLDSPATGAQAQETDDQNELDKGYWS